MSEWQERLVEAITARGITGGELARRTGFSAQYINSLRSKERGARLPLDTARRLASALGVSVEWLTSGNGPRERLSDVYPIYVEGGAPPESATLLPAGSQASPRPDRYPGRAEAVALLSTTVEPEVIAALRAVVPDDPETDPGRERWIAYARNLVRDLRSIKADPLLNPPPPGAPVDDGGLARRSAERSPQTPVNLSGARERPPTAPIKAPASTGKKAK